MIHLDRAHLHPSRIDLVLLECADRLNCKVFYGFNLMMQPWACYYFQDMAEFESAHQKLRMLSDVPFFESMESLNRNRDKNDGVIYVRRPRGGSLLKAMKLESRAGQLKLCRDLVSGIARLHELGGVHGALDEDNVIFDEIHQVPVIVEFVADFEGDVVMPPFRAPEQWHREKPTPATDVYQLAAAYLSAIRDPSKQLHALIDKCQAANPEARPTMAGVERELRVISEVATSQSFWPAVNFKWIRWIPYSFVFILLSLLVFPHFFRPDSNHQVAVRDQVELGGKIWVDGGSESRSFSEFAQALAVVTGKPVTYPSYLDSKKVVNPNGTQKWEDVLMGMGLGWEIQIVKIKTQGAEDPDAGDIQKFKTIINRGLTPMER